MKIVIVFLLSLSIGAMAKNRLDLQVQKSQNWNEFKNAMDSLKEDDRRRGISYITSGSIVMLGSLASIGTTQDMATKVVYGVASSAGIAAITYGIATLYYGNSYNSFYDSLSQTELNESQKNFLVKHFLKSEEDRRENIRRMQLWAHFVAGAMNAYSASIETDKDARGFFTILSGLNFVMALSFSF